MNAADKVEKIKKMLQEYFGQRPTQLHASRELTRTQIRANESIIEFNNRYTVLLEESTDEIPETCSSKIVIVGYINTLYDDVGRKLRSNIVKFDNDPCHPKAIKSLQDTMNQTMKIEKEQKFVKLQDAEIMNISPDNSPQNSDSESDGAEINAIYGNRRYQSRQQRNWNSSQNQNFNIKWQNKGCYNSNYGNRDSSQKSKFKNLKKDKYNNKYDNKQGNNKLSRDDITKLIKANQTTNMITNKATARSFSSILWKYFFVVFHMLTEILTKMLHIVIIRYV